MSGVVTSLRRAAGRGRGAVVLAALLALIGDLLLRFSGGGTTALVSLLDVVLIVVPLAGLVLGTMQVHQARDLTELLLAQPVARGRLFARLWAAAALPLVAALVAGIVAPFAWHGLLGSPAAALLPGVLLAAVLLALLSNALAFVIALRIDDRVRALGVALAAWLVAAVLWDGIVLAVAMIFADRPVETPMLVLLALNPLDIARVLLLLGSDAAAMLGYTGAVLGRVLGATTGRVVLMALLATWLALPLWLARRSFEQKDF